MWTKIAEGSAMCWLTNLRQRFGEPLAKVCQSKGDGLFGKPSPKVCRRLQARNVCRYTGKRSPNLRRHFESENLLFNEISIEIRRTFGKNSAEIRRIFGECLLKRSPAIHSFSMRRFPNCSHESARLYKINEDYHSLCRELSIDIQRKVCGH